MACIAYQATSEKDWQDKVKFLEENGKASPKCNPLFSFGNYPVILVYSNTPVLGGHYANQKYHVIQCWNNVLEFMGLGQLPENWFVKVSPIVLAMLKKLDSNIRGTQLECVEIAWDHKRWEWVRTPGYFANTDGYPEISLERAIKFILPPTTKKTVEAEFQGNTVIIDGVSYKKEQ